MHIAPTANPTLISRIWPESTFPQILRATVLLAIGVLVLTASARLQVPFWPVKMSMQTLAVLLVGMSYGSRLGTATVVTYLALGIFGVPVFVSGGSAAYLGGPTTGYLFGFAAAAWVIGRFSETGWLRSTRRALACFLLADGIIMFCGVAWLATLIGIEPAWHVGFLVFLPAEALKLALVTAMNRLSQRVLN